MFRNKGKRLLAAALSATLALGSVPHLSFAETSAELQVQLDAARTTLNELGNQVQAAGEALYETQYQLEVTTQAISDTQVQIEQEQVQLSGAQDVLSKRVTANYKSGGVDLLGLILQSSSFDELLSNIYYANKVYEQESKEIQQVKDLKTSLETQRASLEQYKHEQEELLEQQTVQMEQLQSQEAAQAEYVNHLDAEVAAALEAERQAELERQRQAAAEAERQRQAAAAAAAAQTNNSGTSNQQPTSGETSGQSESQNSSYTNSGNNTNSNSNSSSSEESYEEEENNYSNNNSNSGGYSGGLSSSARDIIVSAAYSQLGVPYVFGACSAGEAFDCSGFTMWCYAQAGIDLPHSAAAQSGCATSVSLSSLEPGDLVFWIGTGDARLTGNHVALYLGGGEIIHAVWSGVTTQSLYSGVTMYGKIL